MATVHKHVTKLVEKGLLKREKNVNRSIEPVEPDHRTSSRVPLLGRVAAGAPIEAIEGDETLAVPRFMMRSRARMFALRVAGNSMIDEHIQDGDYVIVEQRERAENGEVVIALLDGERATLKRIFVEKGRVRLQPANAQMPPILVEPDRLLVRGVVVGVLRDLRA